MWSLDTAFLSAEGLFNGRTMTQNFAENAVADIPLWTDEHGVIRIGDSGVPLESVIVLFRDGATAEEIAQAFTSLDRADLHYVLGYSLRHSSEVDSYLNSRAAEEARVRAEVESRFDTSDLKARILQRRQAGQ
jgi:uncharacterized protein (DUF433 family)